MTDIFHPTQMLVCFCISILCVLVCACVCLCNFLGACLPVSLAVRARGMTGVGSSPSYYRAFDFTTEAKWDSRCKETYKAVKGRMHAVWLLANNNRFHDTYSINVSLLISFCDCVNRDWRTEDGPCTGHIYNIDTDDPTFCFTLFTHPLRVDIYSQWMAVSTLRKQRQTFCYWNWYAYQLLVNRKWFSSVQRTDKTVISWCAQSSLNKKDPMELLNRDLSFLCELFLRVYVFL